MTAFWIGTSGYANPEWRGGFYPADLPEGHELSVYAGHFNSVELNFTFHRLPSVRMLHAWAKETPETFAFALKAPRGITYDARMLDVGDVVTDFCDLAKTLKNKLGPVLYQLPPFQRRDLPRLEDFLHQLPPEVRHAIEFRHPSWFTDLVFDTLRRFGVALCIAEREELATPAEMTASFAYLRLRLPAYSAEKLDWWAQWMEERRSAISDFFVYLKTGDAVGSLEAATALAARMRERPPVRVGQRGA